MPRSKDNAFPVPAVAAALDTYPLSQEGMIGLQLLPVLSRETQTGTFPAITRKSKLRAREVGPVAPGSAYSRDSYETQWFNYGTQKYGHEQGLPLEAIPQWASYFDAQMWATAIARDVVLREQEKRIAAKFLDTGVWTGAALFTDNSGTPWSTVGTNIVDQVEAVKEIVRQQTGAYPNTIAFSAAQIRKFKKNTAMIEALKYTTGMLNSTILSKLADLFGIQKVLIAGGVKDTADEGQDLSLSDIWSPRYSWIGTTATGAALNQPGVGRTIVWSQYAGQFAAEVYDEPQTESEIYRAKQFTEEKIVDTSFGHLMQIEV